MWAFRRASVHLRNRGLSSGAARICYAKPDVARRLVGPQEKQSDGLLSSARFYDTSSSSVKSSYRSFSSLPEANSSEEKDDDLEDSVSKLEAVDISDDEDDSLEEEEGIADDDDDDDARGELEDGKSNKLIGVSELTKVIVAASPSSVKTALDNWVKEGKEVDQGDLALSMLQLRKRRSHYKALLLSEWMESTKCVEFVEANYASRVDLIAKVHGVFKAEEYLNKQVPKPFKGELLYRTMLACYVSTKNVKKSEQWFEKMKSLKFPVTCLSCNQLLLLYSRTDEKKIADVLLLMENENIKASYLTYQILISVKGQSNDIAGMEGVLKAMKDQGLKPNTRILRSLASYYAANGLKCKSEIILKEIEGDDINKNRWACHLLLPIYASFGNTDEVDRIWAICQTDTHVSEFMAAIAAFGSLKRIEMAEETFERMLKIVEKPTSKHFVVLLKVYADKNMLAKGEDLVKRMGEFGCTPGPLVWDLIVKLYIRAGEVEKADSLLEKAVKQNKARPLFLSYLAVLDQYANRGDIHNAEKIFLKMKQAGYVPRPRQYMSLLQAYVNAKAPAYGFIDRLKADNIFPHKALASILAQADGFRKSPVDELLE